MQIRKAWIRFFVCALLIIGILSAIMMIVFYNSSARQEAVRRESIEDFVSQQKLELITNIVNNMITEINVKSMTAEENAALDLERAVYMFSTVNAQLYTNDRSMDELIVIVGEFNKSVDIIAYNTETGHIFGSSGGEPVDVTGARLIFDSFFDEWAVAKIYDFDNRYLIGFGVKKQAMYNALLESTQKYVDSQVPLGDVEIRIDALHNYDGRGDFATRIIIPFFQRGGETAINAGNADYFNTFEQLVRNGSSLTEYMPDGELDRLIYARLYRPNDWIASASISAEDINQLTQSLSEQFREQQNSAMIIIALMCLMFTVAALGVFVLLGRLFFRHADTEFKIIGDLAQIDALTGIHNRRYMEDGLESIVELLSRSSNGILSVLLVDIDYFKMYNDTYGHQQGDVCLKNVAKALEEAISRTNDFVARYGGEEFIAVLPNTSELGARLIAEKFLENVRALNIPHISSSAAECVTVSIGVTTGRVMYTQNWEDYLKRADKALYLSKQNGRNQYTYLDF